MYMDKLGTLYVLLRELIDLSFISVLITLWVFISYPNIFAIHEAVVVVVVGTSSF